MADVLLLGSPSAGDGPSMTRYARELHAALTARQAGAHTYRLEAPVQGASPLPGIAGRRIANAWFRYITYPRRVRGRSADAFHILDQAYAHLVRELPADRTVVTCHDLIPLLAAEGVITLPMPGTVVRSFRWRMEQMARARHVIAVSHATKVGIVRHTPIPPDRITVVHQGVSPVFARSGDPVTLRATAGLSPEDAVLIHVSSGARYKNTPAILHALAGLRSHERRVVLVRVGAPMHEDEAALAARLRVADRIREMGAVDDVTLAQWYSAADVLVFPSIWEGFGWPPLEAMACGTPVVASDIAPIAEVVGDAGLLMAPHDHSGLESAVKRVLTDSSLATSLRQRGLARTAQFTWGRTADSTGAVYDSVLR